MRADFNCLHQQIVNDILQPLRDPRIAFWGLLIPCSDSKVQTCFPFVEAWLAHIAGKTALAGLKHQHCAQCETPKEDYGDYPKAGRRGNLQQFSSYSDDLVHVSSSLDGQAEALARLETVGINCIPFGIVDLPLSNFSVLFPPNILHTCHLSITKYIMEWVLAFVKKHNRLEAFDKAFCSVPRYPGFRPFNQHYSEVTQWQGKECRMMARILYVILAITLFHPPPPVKVIDSFKKAYLCVAAMVNFILLAQIPKQTCGNPANPASWGTPDWMEWNLKSFHNLKNVFLEERAISKQKAKAKEKARDIVATGEVIHLRSSLATPGPPGPSIPPQTLNSKQVCVQVEEHYHQNLEESVKFDFIRMHSLLHFGCSTEMLESLQQHSTEIGEASHPRMLNDGQHHSNHIKVM